jgi:hypothetical protein
MGVTTEVFIRGNTIEIWAYFKRKAVYVSPDQGVTLTVIDPEGTTKVDAQAMTPSETGKFYYHYTPADDAELKWWRYWCKGQDGTLTSAKYGRANGSFELKE